MSWNYRVHRLKRGDGSAVYSIRETSYDAAGEVYGHCSASVADWDSLEDLKGTVDGLMLAFNRPVLDEKDIPRG